MIYYIADEHYNHANIIRICNRPFIDVDDMTQSLIANHNGKVLNDDDLTIHAGDFFWGKSLDAAEDILRQLRGRHIVVRGNHDYWMPEYPNSRDIYRDGIFEHIYNKQRLVVVSHYAMRVWNKSHFNSWNLHGHSHGNLPPVGKQYDVGVDCNNFTPISYDEIKHIMDKQPNNYGYIDKN